MKPEIIALITMGVAVVASVVFAIVLLLKELDE